VASPVSWNRTAKANDLFEAPIERFLEAIDDEGKSLRRVIFFFQEIKLQKQEEKQPKKSE
jgi:hypothetical protein